MSTRSGGRRFGGRPILLAALAAAVAALIWAPGALAEPATSTPPATDPSATPPPPGSTTPEPTDPATPPADGTTTPDAPATGGDPATNPSGGGTGTSPGSGTSGGGTTTPGTTTPGTTTPTTPPAATPDPGAVAPGTGVTTPPATSEPALAPPVPPEVPGPTPLAVKPDPPPAALKSDAPDMAPAANVTPRPEAPATSALQKPAPVRRIGPDFASPAPTHFVPPDLPGGPDPRPRHIIHRARDAGPTLQGLAPLARQEAVQAPIAAPQEPPSTSATAPDPVTRKIAPRLGADENAPRASPIGVDSFAPLPISGEATGRAGLLQILAGYFVPPGGTGSHMLLLVELACFGVVFGLTLLGAPLLRLVIQDGRRRAGYQAVALRPG